MKSPRKYVLLGLAVVLLAALLSGCSVTVGPEPRYGDIKICVREDSVISGWVYIDGEAMYEYVDGWYGPYCTGWIPVTLDQRHYLEIWNPRDGTIYSASFTPTYDGRTFTLDTRDDGEGLIIY